MAKEQQGAAGRGNDLRHAVHGLAPLKLGRCGGVEGGLQHSAGVQVQSAEAQLLLTKLLLNDLSLNTQSHSVLGRGQPEAVCTGGATGITDCFVSDACPSDSTTMRPELVARANQTAKLLHMLKGCSH